MISSCVFFIATMEGPKSRKNLTNEMIKVLLDTCIEEMKTTGMNGVSLYRSSWVRLGQMLKDKFGMDFTQKEMKNGFDNLKAKYIGWLYLKNKTGNIYNPQTKMFNLTPEQWEDFKKVRGTKMFNTYAFFSKKNNLSRNSFEFGYRFIKGRGIFAIESITLPRTM